MIVGPLGDRYGRRFVLMLTLFLMGSATFAIGRLPTIARRVFLHPSCWWPAVCFRAFPPPASRQAPSPFLWSTPTSTSAPSPPAGPRRAPSSDLLATAVFIPFAALPDEHLLTWGWRVPFWLSAFVVITAWLIRRTLSGAARLPAAREAHRVPARAGLQAPQACRAHHCRVRHG